MNGIAIPDSSEILKPALKALEKYAIHVLCDASALFFPYNLRWAGHIEQTCSTSSIITELLTSISPYALRIALGTVGIIIRIQLVVNYIITPDKNRSFPALRTVPRASVLQGLKANPELTGFILPDNDSEIASFGTINSRMPAGEILRYS